MRVYLNKSKEQMMGEISSAVYNSTSRNVGSLRSSNIESLPNNIQQMINEVVEDAFDVF